MTATLEQAFKSLSSSGLMTGREIELFLEELPPDSRPGDSDALLGQLVQRNRLTRFQAEALVNGAEHPLVLGDHVLLDRLGAGGMGVVYKAWNRRLDRLAAVKVLPATQSPDAIERFRREVKAAARLNHPNIVTTFDAGEEHGTHYLVMEYIEGRDLLRLVRQRGTFSIPAAIGLIVQGARGLQFAHSQGVVHRDVKPSNLLLNRKGAVKILDMGLARLGEQAAAHGAAHGAHHDDAELTSAGAAMGTYGYIAPEQANDARQADERSDIYGLGCTLYFLLAGRTMYSGDSSAVLEAHRTAAIPSLRSVRPDAPEALEAVFQRLVAKRPEDRYASMTEVMEAFRPLREVEREEDGSSVVLDFSVQDDSMRESALQRGESSRQGSTNSLASFKQSTHGAEHAPQPSTRSGQARAAQAGAFMHWGLPGAIAVLLLVGAALAISHVMPLLAGGGNNSDGSVTPLSPGLEGLPVITSRAFTPAAALRYQQETARYLRVDRELTNSLGMQFVLVPAHHVPSTAPIEGTKNKEFELAPPLYFGVHEVTQEEFRMVMGENPSGFASGGEHADLVADMPDTARLPVENVTHAEALDFCQRLSEMHAENVAGRRYRLPTAAQWRVACRAGGIGKHVYGDDPAMLSEYAWYDATSGGRPHAVGLLKPNAFGLYDMLGNVMEHAADQYGGRYGIAGGSWNNWVEYQTARQGQFINQPFRLVTTGFRVVCETPELRRVEVSQLEPTPKQPWDDEVQ